MTVAARRIRPALVLLGAALAAARTLPAQSTPDAARDTAAPRVRVAVSQPLPRLDGDRLKVTVVEVTYGPGGSSAPHSHPCPVIGYVAEGAYRSQVQGEPEAVYHAGETFYEAPNSVHLVSANASRTEQVRFLASFTCDRDTPLSVGAPTNR